MPDNQLGLRRLRDAFPGQPKRDFRLSSKIPSDFDDVGIFDPRFFIFYEEVDLCTRTIRAGYRCIVSKRAKFYRMISGTIGRENPLRYRYQTRNTLLFIQKNSELSNRKKRLTRFTKNVKWDIEDKHLPAFFKTRDWTHLKIAWAMALGCMDYYLGRFGKVRSWGGLI